ncbi:unnamed protein product [Ceratitis capitata]|uniref:(Mediterranean fruit fly) hypothetical protein n=1 Tax=Ceratitis capitata TaxID=7213 RepID=A0A811VGC2_CERCA|nr:unnamed protein product [Ceratitis capitata]
MFVVGESAEFVSETAELLDEDNGQKIYSALIFAKLGKCQFSHEKSKSTNEQTTGNDNFTSKHATSRTDALETSFAYN